MKANNGKGNNCSWIFIPNKRISYEGIDGEGARFPSALIGFNVPKPIRTDGIILEVKKKAYNPV